MAEFPSTKPRRFMSRNEFGEAIKGHCPKCLKTDTTALALQDGHDEYWHCKACGEQWLITCTPSVGQYIDEIPDAKCECEHAFRVVEDGVYRCGNCGALYNGESAREIPDA